MPQLSRLGERLALVAATSLFAASLVQAATIVSCPFDPAAGGDQVTRGFYVTGYAGATLDTVTLRYTTTIAENKTISLTVNSGTYNGPVVGTATASGAMSGTETQLVFNFNNAPVAPGSTLTFTQVLTAGSAPVFFNVGIGPCAGVTETNGTTPPLDTFRRDSVGVVITGSATPLAGSAIPTLGPFGLVALVVVVAGAAAYTLRRRG